MSKVVKYTCISLRQHNYTHDQLNTRRFIIIFEKKNEGGGAQNLSLPPGASYPRYGHCAGWLILHVCQYVFQNHVKSRKIYM